MRTISRIWAAAVAVIFLSTAARAFDEDHKVKINGTTLHFRVRGANKAHPYLLILHGGPGFSAHMFYPWGPALEPSVNVVYLDQRGCGESARLSVQNLQAPKPGEIKGYTVATLVQDIEGVRRSLNVEKWYVLGHSWGGMLGLEYVAAHPERVLGYIHMDGLVSVPWTEDTIFTGAQAKDPALSDQITALRALPAGNPQRLFGAFGLALGPAGLYFPKDQPATFAQFNGKIMQAVTPYHVPVTALLPAPEPEVALIVNDRYLTRDVRPLLARITVPTLILNGRQDGVITPQMAEAVHAGIPRSQMTLLDGCGHFPFVDQPERSAQAVLGFITPAPTQAPS